MNGRGAFGWARKWTGGRGTWQPFIARLLGAYALMILCFSASMTAAYCIPTSLMEGHVRESVEQLRCEGLYPQVIQGANCLRIDNWTNAYMVNLAYQGDSNPLVGAFLNPLSRSETDPIQGFDSALEVREDLSLNQPDRNDEYGCYPRYWHGYLVVLKPLLLFLNIGEIRLVSLAVFWLLAAFVVVRMARTTGEIGAPLALAFSFALCGCFVVGLSLSLVQTFLVALSGCLIVLNARDGGDGLGRLFMPAFVLGGLTAFLDFLCTPVITVGIPLAIAIYRFRADIRCDNVRTWLLGTLACVMLWGVGYVGVWTTKWVLATLVTGRDVIGNAIGQVGLQAGEIYADVRFGADVGRLEALKRCLQALLPTWVVKILIGGGLSLPALPSRGPSGALIAPQTLNLDVGGCCRFRAAASFPSHGFSCRRATVSFTTGSPTGTSS